MHDYTITLASGRTTTMQLTEEDAKRYPSATKQDEATLSEPPAKQVTKK